MSNNHNSASTQQLNGSAASLNHGKPFAAPQSQQAATDEAIKEERLLHLYIEKVAREGTIEYSPLAEYLDQVFEVEVTEGLAVLSEEVDAINDELSDLVAEVATATERLDAVIEQLKTFHIEIGKDSEYIKKLEGEVQEATGNLRKGVDRLYQLGNRYLPRLSYQKQTSVQQEDQETETQEWEWQKKVQHDLLYLSKYVGEQIKVKAMLQQLNQPIPPSIYFRRVEKYLASLAELAETCKNQISDALETRKAGNERFDPANNYRNQ